MIDVAGFDLNAIGPGFIDNPYPVLRALRETAPVHVNPDGSVLLTRHADVQRVYQSRAMLSDKTVEFGRKFGPGPLLTHHTTSLVFNDPPYHTLVRKLLASAFAPRWLAVFEGLIEGIVARLVDRVADLRELDLIAEFAKVLPTEIISFMLGIPQSQRAQLRGYSLAILGALDPVVTPERLVAGNAAVSEFTGILFDIIAHRRAHPDGALQGEVLESLIFGEVEGRRLSEEELMQNCIFLLNAGHETTTSMVGNAVGMLLAHPDQHRRLQADPGLIDTAIEEALRFESPLQQGNRTAAEDLDLGDAVIRAGTYIHTSIAGANRDPAVFDDPEAVDITRAPNRHLAFATGIHVCLGATLARIEGRIAVCHLVRRFPTMAMAGTPRRVPLARFRGWAELPVRVA